MITEKAKIAGLRLALEQCAADWSSRPGTVISAAAELNAEFQRRMQIAAEALERLNESELPPILQDCDGDLEI